MSTITGAVAYQAVVTVTAASGGDATAIAAMFNGVVFPAVSGTAATATAASSIVTITWPANAVTNGDGNIRQIVTGILSANHALTSPVTVTAGMQGYLL